ncbi:hypothetical protein CAPTEDRAFT_210088 [Capitella teleta]|uniref:Uncharacterized protein n=1 Tax=Capitella teleta TaxID=283909 RepID=R7TJK4_CAPTE|nr:hypothetical protein CAPTEDRAFT_210088 [Capitella teleta]|eukprot:ELT93869.1 hypothetical protein CAPTEDRAFT_210088 [Capitella teleta]
MGIQDVLVSFGGFGRYQWIHFILISLSFNLSHHFQTLGIIFTGFYNPNYCKVPSKGTATNIIPTIIGPDNDPPSAQCHRYSVPGDNSSELTECYEGWNYEPDLFHATHDIIVMEVVFFTSFLGDVFDRKSMFIGCMLSVWVLSIINAVVSTFLGFCVVSFLRGMFTVLVLSRHCVDDGQGAILCFDDTLSGSTELLDSVT